MNCCDDAGRCTNGINGSPCATRSSAPIRINTLVDAPATGIRFAPGAIEHHTRPRLGTPAQRRELNRWLRLLVVSAVLCLMVGSVSGFIATRVLGA